jgi:hypothetical protein
MFAFHASLYICRRLWVYGYVIVLVVKELLTSDCNQFCHVPSERVFLWQCACQFQPKEYMRKNFEVEAYIFATFPSFPMCMVSCTWKLYFNMELRNLIKNKFFHNVELIHMSKFTS